MVRHCSRGLWVDIAGNRTDTDTASVGLPSYLGIGSRP